MTPCNRWVCHITLHTRCSDLVRLQMLNELWWDKRDESTHTRRCSFLLPTPLTTEVSKSTIHWLDPFDSFPSKDIWDSPLIRRTALWLTQADLWPRCSERGAPPLPPAPAIRSRGFPRFGSSKQKNARASLTCRPSKENHSSEIRFLVTEP